VPPAGAVGWPVDGVAEGEADPGDGDDGDDDDRDDWADGEDCGVDDPGDGGGELAAAAAATDGVEC
jgi:hypothetical protein